MSISNYSELKTAIQNWVSDSSTISGVVGDFIALAENRIYRDLRIRAMETSLSSAIASGVLAVPSTYVELKFAYIDGSPTQQLQRMGLETLYEKYPARSSSGKPRFIARESSNFIFGPYPDSNYTVKGVYYARLTALSDQNTTNWFTANAADLLLFASLVETEKFLMNDARVKLWEESYQQRKNQIQEEDMREDGSGSVIRSHVSWS